MWRVKDYFYKPRTLISKSKPDTFTARSYSCIFMMDISSYVLTFTIKYFICVNLLMVILKAFVVWLLRCQ